MNLGLVNLGYGNLLSIINSIKKVDNCVNIKLLNNTNDFNKIDRIIFPGNGSLNFFFKNIKNFDFFENLKSKIFNIPFMGICLGKQILFNKSEEGKYNGAGIFKGKIIKFKSKKYKIPHIGWNKVNIKKKNLLLKDIRNNSSFFFSHSYYLKVKNHSVSITKYIVEFSSIYLKNNIFLTQFHPENSGKNGLKIIENFLKWKI